MEHEFPAPRVSIRLWCEGGPQGEAPGRTCMVWGAFAPPHTPESPITYTGAPCAFGKSPSPSAHHSCGSWHGGADAPGQDSLTRPAQTPGPEQGGLVPLTRVTQPLPPAQGTNIPQPSQPIHHVGWVPMCWLQPWCCTTWAGGITPKAIPVPPKHQPSSHLDRGTRSHGVSGARGRGGTCQRCCRGCSDHTGWPWGDREVWEQLRVQKCLNMT